MVHLDDFKHYLYPDGHKHIVSTMDLKGDEALQIRIRSFDDLFLAAQVKAIHPELTRLDIWYMLAGRCDRRFSPGEALDLKIVCDYINSMGWEQISVIKPHSSKTLELLQKGSYQRDYTPNLLRQCEEDIGENVCYVSPDAGASTWIGDYNLRNVMQGSKKRDPETGAVIGVEFKSIYKDFKHFVIIDDLCDGGGTFTAIAREIRLHSPEAKVYLVVTHAIFSKGFTPFEGLIDRIYCTNSFSDIQKNTFVPIIKQLKVS